MTESTKVKPRHGGLDWSVPREGRAREAYEVATTALVLARKFNDASGCPVGITARHATRLHVISGLLHRIAERQCNEDLTCPKCRGARNWASIEPIGHDNEIDCSACAGTGLTTGRKLESLRADAQEIAVHYGLACYFQGDPRGCSLYIGEPEALKADYNRGHAVTRLGR